jgi:hypothetical protein
MSNTPYIMKKGVSALSDLVDGGSVHGYPGAYPGQTYYVNKVTGLSTYDGLTWDRPFAQLSTAITAAEAYRQLAASANQYVRNIIYVQGVSTAYSAVSALPNYCDIIGVGAQSNGNGTGIAMISGAGAADAMAGTARGLRLFNLQLIATGAYWCLDLVNLFRSEIAFCCFQSLTTATDGAIRFSDSAGGNYIHDNWMTGSGNVIHKVGMQIQGGNFDSNRIEDNEIIGTTAGVLVDNTCSTGINGTAADNTVFKNNVIGDLGRGCAKGVDDNEVVGMITYVGNYITATDAIELTHRGDVRAIGNHVINTTTGAVELTGT